MRKYNEIVVNKKSNFKSHLVKCQSVMDDLKNDHLVIRGMGKATIRAVNLALQLNANNYNTFDLKPKTYSVEILEDLPSVAYKDAFDPDDVRVPRKVSQIPAIEIIVMKNKLELDKIRQVKSLNRYPSE